MYSNPRDRKILPSNNNLKNKNCKDCDVKDNLIRYILDGHFRRVKAVIATVCDDCIDGTPHKLFISNFRNKKANKCNNDCYLFAHNLCETETGDGLCDREKTPRKVDEVAGKRTRFR